MRMALVLIVATLLAPTALASDTGSVQQRITKARQRTHQCQRTLGLRPSPVATRVPHGRYAHWVLTLWRARAKANCRLARQLGHPEVAIRAVFGPHATEALVVARCESRYNPHARNGQYLGLFQMGENERATYGHGDTPLAQAVAAHRYFVASGEDWSPWQCRPDGGLAW